MLISEVIQIRSKLNDRIIKIGCNFDEIGRENL